MKLKITLFALVFASCVGLVAEDITLLNVSYDPTRELYREFNQAFSKYWKNKSGQSVTINQSHGGSGKQAGSSPSLDLGKARFKRETYALTWSPFSRLTFALGFEKLKSKDKNGESTKVNNFQSIPTFTSGTTLSDQADSVIRSNSNGAFVSNDFGGKPKENKQVFIRGVYEF